MLKYFKDKELRLNLFFPVLAMLFFSCTLFGEDQVRQNYSLYFIKYSSNKLSAAELKKQLDRLDVKLGGKRPLGEIVRGSPYFHFYVDQADTTELTQFLQQYGTVTMAGVHDYKPLIAGKVRWILCMDSQDPPFPQVMQFIQKDAQAVDMVSAPLEKARLGRWIKNQIHLGDIDVSANLPETPKSPELIYITNPTYTPATPVETNTLTVKLILQSSSCPHPSLRYPGMNARKLQRFIDRYNSCYQMHFEKAAALQKTFDLRADVVPADQLILMANMEAYEPGIIKKRKIATDAEAPVIAKRGLFRKTDEKQGSRFRVLGSLVQVQKTWTGLAELGAEYYYNRIGGQLRYLTMPTSIPEDVQFSSVDLVLGYRMLPMTAGIHRNFFPHVLYRSFGLGHVTGNFYGLGVSYQDEMWPIGAKIFEYMPWKIREKTVEVGFEYYPWTNESTITKTRGYSGYIRAMLFSSYNFATEMGFQYQSIAFQKSNSNVDRGFVFAQLGISYGFD